MEKAYKGFMVTAKKEDSRTWDLFKDAFNVLDNLSFITTFDITDGDNNHTLTISDLAGVQTDIKQLWKKLFFGLPQDKTATEVTKKAIRLGVIDQKDSKEFAVYLMEGL